jgi:hypothetical protein
MTSGLHSTKRTSAWFQGMALVAAIGVPATLLLLEVHRPLDQDTLAILTGQLRSDVREARELARLDALHASYATFTQQHARELGQHVEDVVNTLRSNRAAAALEPVRREAEELARDIHSALSAVAVDHALASDKATQLDRLCDRAQLVHLQLKPGG